MKGERELAIKHVWFYRDTVEVLDPPLRRSVKVSIWVYDYHDQYQCT